MSSIRTKDGTKTFLRDAVPVGHSMGGGKVARYIGRHGTTRIAKAILVSAVPPRASAGEH